MKYIFSTKHRVAKIELDEHGILINGSDSFREYEGLSLVRLTEKFADKKYVVRLIPIEEVTSGN